jgi:hypothetical protein
MRLSILGTFGLLGLAAAIRPSVLTANQIRELVSRMTLIDQYIALTLLQRAETKAKHQVAHVAKRDVDPASLYPAHNLSVPIDFFPNEARYEPHLNGSFNLSYWFDATYYKPGGPVFVLLGGETAGSDRLGFLQKGIVAQVAQATNGLGVILEHRYYGTSFPTPDLTVENLRFLSTEQALAEIDYFARNVKFEGVDADLTAPNTPWIAYGGSYAGAQAAFLRVVYPDTFWGTISSSGVTTAIYDYWQYFEPIRQFAPPDVVQNTQFMVDVVDSILLRSNNTAKAKQLKTAFGLGNVTDNSDFANVLTGGIYGWQSTNWDPELNSPSFWYYQNNMTSTLNFNATASQRATVKDLITFAGYQSTTVLENVLLNAIHYFDITTVSRWRRTKYTQDQYFTQLDPSAWEGTSLSDYTWRSWQYQVCTEWGYLQTGDTPVEIKPLVSRLIDLDYTSFPCRAAFNITEPSHVENVNKYGNFSIEYPRLAITGGNADPWRPATPLADNAPKRNSTTEEPVILIAHGVHHWEENGLFPNETTPILPPNQVVFAQQSIKNFVIDWLKGKPPPILFDKCAQLTSTRMGCGAHAL